MLDSMFKNEKYHKSVSILLSALVVLSIFMFAPGKAFAATQIETDCEGEDWFIGEILKLTKRSSISQVTKDDLEAITVFKTASANGKIPKAVKYMKNLTEFNIGGSGQVRGGIPGELTSLAKLTKVDLSLNQFTGSIPAFSASLSYLDVSGNQLTGSIPSGMTGLTFLNASDNKLSGAIPSAVTGYIKLKSLLLNNNGFTGSIPSGIGNLSSLTELDLSYNKLSGAIPSGIGGLRALTALSLNNNSLSGSVPSSIGGLAKLKILHLQNNKLTGAIPSEFSGLTAAEDLWIQNNMLVGTLPAIFGKSGISVDIESNYLSGSVAKSVRGNSLNFIAGAEYQYSISLPSKITAQAGKKLNVYQSIVIPSVTLGGQKKIKAVPPASYFTAKVTSGDSSKISFTYDAAGIYISPKTEIRDSENFIITVSMKGDGVNVSAKTKVVASKPNTAGTATGSAPSSKPSAGSEASSGGDSSGAASSDSGDTSSKIENTINTDSNHNSFPDLNIDTDGDGKPDLNVDTNGDGVPDVNIDLDGDGKPDLNLDTNGDGTPDKIKVTLAEWKPSLVSIDGTYETDTEIRLAAPSVRQTDGGSIPAFLSAGGGFAVGIVFSFGLLFLLAKASGKKRR